MKKKFELDKISGLDELIVKNTDGGKEKITVYLSKETVKKLEAVGGIIRLTVPKMIGRIVEEEVKRDIYEKALKQQEEVAEMMRPLINMKYVLTNAVAENILTEDEKDALLKIAKKTFYPKRNYAQTLAESDLDNDTKSNLINFIRESPDIKKEDAKDLLKTIKKKIE